MLFAHLTSRKAQRVKQAASLAFSLFFLLHSLAAVFEPDAREFAPEQGNSPFNSEYRVEASASSNGGFTDSEVAEDSLDDDEAEFLVSLSASSAQPHASSLYTSHTGERRLLTTANHTRAPPQV